MNMKELLQNSVDVMPDVFTRMSPGNYQFSDMKVQDMWGVETKLVTSIVRGSFKVPYKVVVQWHDVEEGYVHDETPCTVRCSCPMFNAFYARVGIESHTIFGRIVPVEMKVKPGKVAPNPMKLMGVCKHIGLVVMRLDDMGILQLGHSAKLIR